MKIEQSGLLAFGLLVCIKSVDSVTFFVQDNCCF